MKHYPHHIGDFDRATRHLTRIERSIYRDLIDLYYDTEQQLPLDIQWLCRKIIARTNEESTAVEQTLNEFFTETPTGWFHERCEAEIQHYRNNNSQKAQAGKASAAAKALKKQQALNARATDVATDVEQTNNGTPTNQNQNQNQEPIKKEKEKSKQASHIFVLPDWINQDHWNTWHDTPKRRKATPGQKQMAVNKLAAWRDAGEDFAGALENAALAGNQGLFLPNKKPAQSETFRERDARLGREKWERMTGEQHPDNNPAAPSRSILDVVDVEMKMIGAMQ